MPGKSHGRRSLVGYSPWGLEELGMTERLHFHFSLSCIGEGNGSPLQCSCLENPRDGRAWWAAVYGVTQSRTRLKRFSSSRSSSRLIEAFSRSWLPPKEVSKQKQSSHGIHTAGKRPRGLTGWREGRPFHRGVEAESSLNSVSRRKQHGWCLLSLSCGQGTRSRVLQLKIPHATMKIKDPPPILQLRPNAAK